MVSQLYNKWLLQETTSFSRIIEMAEDLNSYPNNRGNSTRIDGALLSLRIASGFPLSRRRDPVRFVRRPWTATLCARSRISPRSRLFGRTGAGRGSNRSAHRYPHARRRCSVDCRDARSHFPGSSSSWLRRVEWGHGVCLDAVAGGSGALLGRAWRVLPGTAPSKRTAEAVNVARG